MSDKGEQTMARRGKHAGWWLVGPVLVVVLAAGAVLATAGGREAVARTLSNTVAGVAGPPPIPVTTFGVAADGRTDDAAAIQRAFDALSPGDTLEFPPGTYLHSAAITVRVPRVTITGPGTLVATDESNSALRVDADGVTLSGLTLGVSATTRRSSEPLQQKLWISGHTGVVVQDVTITGSAAAGVFVQGASQFRLDRVTVKDTRADGIHITKGSHDGVVDHAVVSNTGDDGIAVVSYDGDGPSCHDITVSSPQVLGTAWGRGLSVVGGTAVTFTDVLVRDTDAAALYIAVEGDPYYAGAVQDVTVKGGTLLRANRNTTIDHGAILVLSGRPGVPVRNVDIADLAVDDTRATASHAVGVVTDAGAAPPENLRFENLTFQGGPAATFGGNAPQGSYAVSG